MKALHAALDYYRTLLPFAGVLETSTIVDMPAFRSLRICSSMLHVAAVIAPSDVRTEWVRERNGEVSCAGSQIARSRASGVAPSLCLLARCCGAFVHATSLR